MRRGFTLLELLVVVVLIGIIMAASAPFLGDSVGKNELQSTTWEVVDSMRRAQSQAVAGEEDSEWSVHIQSDQVVIFDGSTYNASDPDNVVIEIPNVLTISTISLNGGGNDVTFHKIEGTTDEYGTVTIEENNTGETKVVTISEKGLIE